MFTVVTLHGELGRIAGKSEWRLSVKSVGEALRAIEFTIKRRNRSIFDYLATHENGAAEYRVIIDGRDHESFEELVTPLKHYKSIDIIPVPQGSGSNGAIWQIVIGVLLIAAGIILAYAVPGGGTVAGITITKAGITMIATALILNGVALAIGGLVQLLNPTTTAEDDNSPRGSYLFSQVVNGTNQGGPVPVGYGKMIIGSQVISSTVRTVDYGTVVQGAGEPQLDLSDHPNPAASNPNVLSLAGNAIPVTILNDPRNPLAAEV